MGSNHVRRLEAQIAMWKKQNKKTWMSGDSPEDIEDCMNCRLVECINCKAYGRKGRKAEKKRFEADLLEAYVESESIYQIMRTMMEYRDRIDKALEKLELPRPGTLTRSEREILVKERKQQYGIGQKQKKDV